MSSVLQYIRTNFPSFNYVKTNQYEVGTVLFTANPYFRTNATIIEVLIKDSMYKVLTDIGNVVDQSKTDLEKWYLPPCCKRSAVDPLSDEEVFRVSHEHVEFKYGV